MAYQYILIVVAVYKMYHTRKTIDDKRFILKKMVFFIIYSIQNIENVKIEFLVHIINPISLQRMSHCFSLRVGLHEMRCNGKTI